MNGAIQLSQLPKAFSDGWLVSTCVGSFAHWSGNPTVAVGQLNCPPSEVPTDVPESESVGFPNHYDYAQLLWASIAYQLVKVVTAFFIFLHFPIHHCFRSFLRLLVSWSLRDLRVPLSMASKREGQIQEHLMKRPKSRKSIAFEIHVARSSA